MAKKVFKKQKGTIRLQVFDLLKQNTGLSRSTSMEELILRIHNTLRNKDNNPLPLKEKAIVS